MSVTVDIVRTPDTLHGKPRIEGTRIGVFQIGESIRRGEYSVEEFVAQFDLSEAEVEAALEYYDDHPDEMATLRAQREARFRRIQAQSRAPDASGV